MNQGGETRPGKWARGQIPKGQDILDLAAGALNLCPVDPPRESQGNENEKGTLNPGLGVKEVIHGRVLRNYKIRGGGAG